MHSKQNFRFVTTQLIGSNELSSTLIKHTKYDYNLPDSPISFLCTLLEQLFFMTYKCFTPLFSKNKPNLKLRSSRNFKQDFDVRPIFVIRPSPLHEIYFSCDLENSDMVIFE